VREGKAYITGAIQAGAAYQLGQGSAAGASFFQVLVMGLSEDVPLGKLSDVYIRREIQGRGKGCHMDHDGKHTEKYKKTLSAQSNETISPKHTAHRS
jgi:hypothetical protein